MHLGVVAAHHGKAVERDVLHELTELEKELTEVRQTVAEAECELSDLDAVAVTSSPLSNNPVP